MKAKIIANHLFNPLESGVYVIHNFLPPVLHNLIIKYLNTITNKYEKEIPWYGTTFQDYYKTRFKYPFDYPINELFKRYKRLRNNIMKRTFSARSDLFEISSLFYPKGSKGIGPHIDHSYSVNMKAIYIVQGLNPFCTAKTKSKIGKIQHLVYPNSLVLMRGPRNPYSGNEKKLRPIHFIEDIIEDRTMIMIQETDIKLKKRISNKSN